MKVGDLVKCGDEIGIILNPHWPTKYTHEHWIECFWPDGEIEPINARDAEVISESR